MSLSVRYNSHDVMLEGLDRIDWRKLSHAYGPATDVPKLLRALASPNKEARDRAVYELYGNIFHQWTRYQATAYAVPFLFELLQAPGVSGKDDVIHLLVACATGYAEAYLPRGLDIGDWQTQLQRATGEDRDYIRWFVAAYEAVRRGVPIFMQLAEHGDGEVRLAATFALAWFREDARNSIDLVRRRLGTEESPLLIANAALALGILAGYLGEDETERLRPLLAANEAIVRQAAAIALVTSLGSRASPDAVREIVQALTSKPLSGLPWNEGDMVGHAAKTLRFLGPTVLETALTPLLDSLRRSSGIPAVTLAGVLLQLLFPEGAKGLSATNLTRQQRAFLTVLAESPSVWLIDGDVFANFSLMMGDWGLPASVEEARAYLHG